MNCRARVLGILAAVGTATCCVGQGTIVGVGELAPGFGSSVSGVSSNGLVVIGYANVPAPVGTDTRAFRWTSATGIQSLGSEAGLSYATGTNSDGSVVVGRGMFSNQSRAFRWTQSGGFENLGTLAGYDTQSGANAVSADGQVVVGTCYQTGLPPLLAGFRWTASQGMTAMPSFPGDTTGTASGISSAGDVITGVSGVSSYVWTVSAGLQAIPAPLGATYAQAKGICADGTTVFGHATDGQFPSAYAPAFRWRQGLGARITPNVAPFVSGVASAASAHGDIIVGACATSDLTPSSGVATLWTRPLGQQDLKLYLTSRNVNLSAWALYEATGISGDGKIIVGNGRHEVSPGVFREEGWVVTLNAAPETCYANIDLSTAPPILNANDFQAFLGRFAALEPTANCDDSVIAPVFNVNDFQCFLNAFAAGCS